MNLVLVIVVSILAIVELRMEYNLEKIKLENQKLLEDVSEIRKDTIRNRLKKSV